MNDNRVGSEVALAFEALAGNKDVFEADLKRAMAKLAEKLRKSKDQGKPLFFKGLTHCLSICF